MRASVIVAFAAIIAAPALAQPAPDTVTLIARAFSQKYSLSARDVMEAVIDVFDRRGLLDEPNSIRGGSRGRGRSANNGESFLTGPSILNSPSNTEANNRGQRRFAAGGNRGNAHSGNRHRPASGQGPPESSDSSSSSSSSDSDSSDSLPGEAAQRAGQAQAPRRGVWMRLGAGRRAGTSTAQRGQGPASGQGSTANSRGSGGASGSTSNSHTGGPVNVNVGNFNGVYRQVDNSVRVGPGVKVDLSVNNRGGAPPPESKSSKDGNVSF